MARGADAAPGALAMTNFQANAQPSRLRWLTPERAVLVLPIAAGIVVAGLMTSLVLTPLLVRLQSQREQLNALTRLRDEVPLLREQLNSLLIRLEQRQDQEQWLLQLVAGTGELDTFLAALNDLAERTGVTITRAVPGPVQLFVPPPKPVEGQAGSPAPAAAGAAPTPVDPLLREGLERRSAELAVSGSFAGLLAFLRALESLEVFVEASDLTLNSPPGNTEAKDQPKKLDLSLKLSAYGRQANRDAAPTP